MRLSHVYDPVTKALDQMLTMDEVSLQTISYLVEFLTDLVVIITDLAIEVERLDIGDRALALGRDLVAVLESASMVIGGQGISDLPEV